MTSFPAPARLENDIVLLLPLEPKWFPELGKVGADPDLWILNPRRMQDPEDMADYLEDAMMEKEKGISIPFVIIDKRTGEVAGSTRYSNLYPNHKRLEIGWTWLGRQHWRTASSMWMQSRSIPQYITSGAPSTRIVHIRTRASTSISTTAAASCARPPRSMTW